MNSTSPTQKSQTPRSTVTLTAFSPTEAAGTINGKPFTARFGHAGLVAFAGQGRWRAYPESLTRRERIAIGKALTAADRDPSKRPHELN